MKNYLQCTCYICGAYNNYNLLYILRVDVARDEESSLSESAHCWLQSSMTPFFVFQSEPYNFLIFNFIHRDVLKSKVCSSWNKNYSDDCLSVKRTINVPWLKRIIWVIGILRRILTVNITLSLYIYICIYICIYNDNIMIKRLISKLFLLFYRKQKWCMMKLEIFPL